MKRMTNSYSNTITYLKAIGIILMVVGHCTYEVPYVRQIIYMFHMPLFFFVAGYCFKEKYLRKPLEFVKKRIEKLYYPYIKWGLIFLFFHNLFFVLNIYNTNVNFMGCYSHPYTKEEYIIKAFNVLLLRDPEQVIGGYWFLNALFWGSIISLFLLKILPLPEISAALSILICLLMDINGLYFPVLYITPQTFMASFLFIVGYICSYRHVPSFRRWHISFAVFLTIVGSFYWRLNVDEPFYSFYNIIPYLLTALLMVWALFSIMEQIEFGRLNRMMRYIGNNTLTILTFHFLSFKIVSLIIVLLYMQPLERIANFPVIIEYASSGWWVFYSVVGVFFPLICKRMLSFLRRQISYKITT